MPVELIVLAGFLGVVGVIAYDKLRTRKIPTEADYTHLLSAAIAAERHAADLRTRRDCTRTSFEQAQFEVTLTKAEQRAGQLRWQANEAGRKCGLVEDMSW
jgi:hypothetical protein